MDRQTISKRVAELAGDLTRLNCTLHAMETTDIEHYPNDYEFLSTDALLRGEKFTCGLRDLLFASTSVRKRDYHNLAGAVLGIKIRYEHGIMEITMPLLLQKRKQRQNTDFLFDPLYFALEKYISNNPVPRFRHCVLCFTHIYDRELPKRRVTDCAGMETKQVLDVVSPFVLTNDGPLLCDAYYATELGNEDCTILSIMTKNNFPTWLNTRTQNMKSIPDLDG